MTILRRAASVLIALTIGAAGLAAFWNASNALLLIVSRNFGLGIEALPAVLGILVGIVLVGLAVTTAALSTLGILVLGVLSTVLGALLLVPSGDPANAPAASLLRAVSGVNLDVGAGMASTIGTGMSLVTGLVLVAAAIAIRLRRRSGRPPHATARIASLAVVIVLPVALAIAISGGGQLFTEVLRLFSGRVDPASAALLVAGALLAAAAVFSIRWSSIGVAAAALLMLVPGVLFLAAPMFAFEFVRVLPPRAGTGTSYVLVTGQLLLLAAVLGALALQAKVAGWRGVGAARRRELAASGPSEASAEPAPPASAQADATPASAAPSTDRTPPPAP